MVSIIQIRVYKLSHDIDTIRVSFTRGPHERRIAIIVNGVVEFSGKFAEKVEKGVWVALLASDVDTIQTERILNKGIGAVLK